jgi:hypothetical protein
MRKVYDRGTIESALDFVTEDVFELQDEMNGAAENMPEQLSTAHADAAQLLDVALSYMRDCTAPSELSDVEVTWVEWRGKKFRPQRRDNVVSFLQAYLGQVPQTDSTKKLRSDLQSAIDVLKNVYFPGMGRRRAA